MNYNDDVVFALMLLRSHPDSTRPHESSKTMQNLKLSLLQTAWAKNVWSHTHKLKCRQSHTHKLKCRYVTPASQSHISYERRSPFRWAIGCKHEIDPPCLDKLMIIILDRMIASGLHTLPFPSYMDYGHTHVMHSRGVTYCICYIVCTNM